MLDLFYNVCCCSKVFQACSSGVQSSNAEAEPGILYNHYVDTITAFVTGVTAPRMVSVIKTQCASTRQVD